MVFVYIRIYFAAKQRARRGIRKRPPKVAVQSTSFATVAKMMPLAHIHSLAGDGPFPGGLMIPGAEQEEDAEAPAADAALESPAIATVEGAIKQSLSGENRVQSAMISIPIVTCDFASDVSISEADPSMQENGDAYLETPSAAVFIQQHTSHPLASAFRLAVFPFISVC